MVPKCEILRKTELNHQLAEFILTLLACFTLAACRSSEVSKVSGSKLPWHKTVQS